MRPILLGVAAILARAVADSNTVVMHEVDDLVDDLVQGPGIIMMERLAVFAKQVNTTANSTRITVMSDTTNFDDQGYWNTQEERERMLRKEQWHAHPEPADPFGRHLPGVHNWGTTPFIRMTAQGTWEAGVPIAQYLFHLGLGGDADQFSSPYTTRFSSLGRPAFAAHLPDFQAPIFLENPYRDASERLQANKENYLSRLLDGALADGFQHRVFASEDQARQWIHTIAGSARDFDEIPSVQDDDAPILHDTAGIVSEELTKALNLPTGATLPRTYELQHFIPLAQRPKAAQRPPWTSDHAAKLAAAQDDFDLPEIVRAAARRNALLQPIA